MRSEEWEHRSIFFPYSQPVGLFVAAPTWEPTKPVNFVVSPGTSGGADRMARLIADLMMFTDNVVAIAGASEGSFFLVLFGLGFSIPIAVGGAALIAALMDRCRSQANQDAEAGGWAMYYQLNHKGGAI